VGDFQIAIPLHAYGGLVQFRKEISLEYVLVLDRGNFYSEKGRYCSTGRSIGIVRRYCHGGSWCLIALPLRLIEDTWERDHVGDPGVDGSSGSGMWGCELDRAGSG